MSAEPLTAEEYADILYNRAVAATTPRDAAPSAAATNTPPEKQRSMDGATFKFLLVAAGVLVAELVLAFVVVKDSSRKSEIRARERADAHLVGADASASSVSGGAGDDRHRRRTPPPHQMTTHYKKREDSNSVIVEPYEAERPDGYASIYQNGTYAVL